MRGILSDHDMEGHFRALISIWEKETLAQTFGSNLASRSKVLTAWGFRRT